MATMTHETPLTNPSRPSEFLQETADEIHDLVTQLLPLYRDVHHLVDRRNLSEPSLGFLTPDARQALDQATREERAARIDTKPRNPGQQWMRGTGDGYLLGDGRLPGRHGATSAEAEIAFTLSQHAHRIEVALNLAGTNARAYIDENTTTAQLISLVDQYVDVILDANNATDKAVRYGRTARRQLTALRRDLEHLVSLADRVVNGVATTTYGDCPHCGRPTIVVDLTTETVTCDVDRRTNEHEHCQCRDAYCACRFKPVEFRHTWSGARGVWRFGRLRRDQCDRQGHVQGNPEHRDQHHQADDSPVDEPSTNSQEHP